MIRDHEIDYHIHGEEMQCVEIELDPQETVIAEAGSFMRRAQTPARSENISSIIHHTSPSNKL